LANGEQALEMEKLKALNDELKEHQTTVTTLNSKLQELEKVSKIFSSVHVKCF
jgi:predicted RNase H-like nuclease (RuvC/YqgF family)